MFGTKKAPAVVQPGKVQSIVGEGTQIRGTIHSCGVVRIDGLLEGSIEHDGELIVGPKGKVVATVKSTDLALAGELHGDVQVEGRLELLSGAQLYGDIRCGHLVVHDGALFHGRSLMSADENGHDSVRE
ncbi:MAG: bactofilin family protein [Mycobacterium leprae]